MNYKKIPWYLLYAVVLFGYLALACYLDVALARYNSVHFNIIWLIALALPVIYMIFGCLLGLDHLIGQARQNGTWSVDAVRLIVLCLPALYFSYYIGMLVFGPIRAPILPILLSRQFFDIAAVVFGYMLITSFHKK